MDEPLSNLDAKLRVEMRTVIKDIQHAVGITNVYVTYDQEEAMAVSDRIAVMNHGDIQQIGTPKTIYLNTEPQDGVLRATIDSSVFLGINTHYFLHTEKGEPIEVIQESLIDQTILDGTKVWLTVKKREDQCPMSLS